MPVFVSMPRSFYEPAADEVAPRLLGHWLVRNMPQGPCGGAIVETEAYLTGDAASHAFRGETKRNRSMWGPPGHGYVYFIYGNHWCFNAVCQRTGIGEAVLIRAIQPLFGADQMQSRRRLENERALANGPGKLCAALDIDCRLDGLDLCDVNGPLFIAENPAREEFLKKSGPVQCAPRIGISRAATLPLRFYLPATQFVSRRFSGGSSKAGKAKSSP